jgi:hypothetical protein
LLSQMNRNLVESIYRRFSRNIAHFVSIRLWWPCLLPDRNKMSNLNRGPSMGASYQFSFHLAKLFQRRRFLEICQSETRIVYGGHVC